MYENKDGRGQIEYGAPHPIASVGGQKFVPWAAETKTDAGADRLLREARERLAEREKAPAEGGDARTAPVPGDYDGDDEAVSWMALPEQAATPEQRRGAQIALLAAEESLPGLPKNLTIKYMLPFDESLYRLHADALGAAPRLFKNVARPTSGTWFPSQPRELWVSLRSHPIDVGRAVLHEAVHCWYAARDVRGVSREAEEAEADRISDELLEAVLRVADQEGGLAG